MKICILSILTLIYFSASSQKLVSDRSRIDAAMKELRPALDSFNECIVSSNLEICTKELEKYATTKYNKYVIGGMLYLVDKEKSFYYHEQAYNQHSNDINFILEYAIELHRKGKYKEAAELYERYNIKEPDNFNTHVWLADCYINLGKTALSIAHWNQAKYAINHTKIDFAIHVIYGKTDQLQYRNQLREQLKNNNSNSVYPLIYQDINWEKDWWNSINQEYLLQDDLQLIKQELGENHPDYKIVLAYSQVKELSKVNQTKDSIISILTQNQLILDAYPLPSYGKITSDLLRICFNKNILSPENFYKQRGQELLELATVSKDVEILNIYAYLQATVEGKVDPSIDKIGWTEFNDERFAISYFVGKIENLKYGDTELEKAISDFPKSAKLFWIKTNCAKNEQLPLNNLLTELIKKEFKTLDTNDSHYSSSLNTYFSYLNSVKQ